MYDYMSNEKLDELVEELEMTMLDYGPDAILMKGLDGRNWRLEGLRGARRLRGAEEDPRARRSSPKTSSPR